uniref:Cytochrome c biogenesis protein CcsB n=1 Tax=Schimmelmannia schousboei TaxID=173468 RepID=A0A1C9C8W8_9FLOR|nr:c-type cytochrome biogenensis protein [Schimmelmannia schousboei]AOM64812.1 c-type cytochrome biogenensis protein [Schimmelmannia schousboei]
MTFLTKKNIIWNLTKKLGNLNFSILMLLSIAFFSLIGSIIEQDQNLSYYQIHYPIQNTWTSIINWKLIISLGLDNLYTTWWFISILSLFGSSLIICTFSRQLPGLKNARTWKFIKPQKTKKQFADQINLENKSLPNILYALHQKNYYIFQKENSMYAYKGIIGRIAPIIVHISIILILTGAVIGFCEGFTAQEMTPKGEVFHIKNIIKSGFNSNLPNNLVYRIDNFSIEYNLDNSIKQFFSDISILNTSGKCLKSTRLSVNSPFVFQGITFYQTDWKINSLRLNINNNKIIQIPLNKITLNNKTFWICNFITKFNNSIFLIVTGLQNKILVYNSEGKLINAINLHETININKTTLAIQEIIPCTGLQIKTDPGIIIVYTGFAFLMLSTISSYLSYSQIWVNTVNNNLELAGLTNRAILIFEEDLISIQEKYILYTFNESIKI